MGSEMRPDCAAGCGWERGVLARSERCPECREDGRGAVLELPVLAEAMAVAQTPRGKRSDASPAVEDVDIPIHVRRRALADVTPRAVRFLVPGLVPLRTLTLIAGVGGLGKSTLALAYAAKLTRGELPDIPASDVVIVSFEDTAAEVLRPRLEAAQADLARVHELYVEPDDGGLVVLPRHVGDLEIHIRETGAKLVILDPIIAAIDLPLDAFKDQHVRAVLAQLTSIAEDTNSALVGIGHLNKAPSGDAYLRVANSTAFWNASRSVVLVTEDPEEPDHHRLVTQRKTNWSAQVGVERHVIESVQLEHIDPATGRPIVTSRMVFVEKATDIDASTVLLAPSEKKSTRATTLLASMLGDGDWHDSDGLKTLAGASGISERTLQRAANELGVETQRRGDFQPTTEWRLPVAPRSTPQFGATLARLQNPHEQTDYQAPEGQSRQIHVSRDFGATADDAA
jgi:hypothetical protein